MDNSPNNRSFISGIHNYCDRWCERCPFTDRCQVFAMAEESPDDDADIETVVRTLTGVFADAKQMLIEQAEELGIDPFSISDEQLAEIRLRGNKFVDEDALSHLADRYWCTAKEILDDDLLLDDESLADILSVLGWYLYFIPVMVKCGLHGLLDDEGFEDQSEQLGPQSHANGKVKIALIAIERSLLAWNQLDEAGYADRASAIIDLLETIRVKLGKKFPLARDFIRPGFDEVLTVM